MEEDEQQMCCRTCLTTLSVEGFVDLNSVIESNDLDLDKDKEFNCDNEGEFKIVTYSECLNNCLLHCTDSKKLDHLPKYICVKCSVTLQIINGFVEKARKSQDTLIALHSKRHQEQELPSAPLEESENESDNTVPVEIKTEISDDEIEFVYDSEEPISPSPRKIEKLQDADDVGDFKTQSVIENTLGRPNATRFLTTTTKIDVNAEGVPTARRTTNTKIIIRRFYNTTCKVCNVAFETKPRLNAHLETCHKRRRRSEINTSMLSKKMLIAEVKKHKLLYQRTDELDKELKKKCLQRAKTLNIAVTMKSLLQLAKECIWEKIGAKLNMDPTEAKNSWKQVRAHFSGWKARRLKQPGARFVYQYDMDFLN